MKVRIGKKKNGDKDTTKKVKGKGQVKKGGDGEKALIVKATPKNL